MCALFTNNSTVHHQFFFIMTTDMFLIIHISCVVLQRPSQWSAPRRSSRTSALSLPSHPSAIMSSHYVRRAREVRTGASCAGTSARLWRMTCATRSTPSHAPTRSSSCSWSFPSAACSHTLDHPTPPAASGSACRHNVRSLTLHHSKLASSIAKENQGFCRFQI